MIQPDFILPKTPLDNDPYGFSKCIFFISLAIQFKDFDCGEKIDEISYSIFSKIWIVIANDEKVGKTD